MAFSGENGDRWDPNEKNISYSDENETQIAQTSETGVSSDTTKDKIKECQDDNKDEIRMLIAGKRGVGKSSLANSIAGERMQKSNWDLGTVTRNSAKLKCKRQDLSLTYFDTPSLSFNVDEEKAQNEYKKCLIRAAPGLHAILIVQKATEFTSSNEAFLDYCTKIFGENCWKYVIFVFTHIDELKKRDLKDQIEDSDESLKRWLSKCGNRYVGINNNLKGTGNDQQIKRLLSAVKDLMKTNKGEIYTNDEFQEIYQMMQNDARDGNLTLNEVRQTFLNSRVFTGVCEELFWV